MLVTTSNKMLVALILRYCEAARNRKRGDKKRRREAREERKRLEKERGEKRR